MSNQKNMPQWQNWIIDTKILNLKYFFFSSYVILSLLLPSDIQMKYIVYYGNASNLIKLSCMNNTGNIYQLLFLPVYFGKVPNYQIWDCYICVQLWNTCDVAYVKKKVVRFFF